VRNLADHPFSHRATEEVRQKILHQLQATIRDIDPRCQILAVDPLTLPERAFLAERRMAGRDFVKNSIHPRCVAFLPGTGVGLRIHDGEHLKISILYPGLDLERAHAAANEWDDAFAQRLSLAFTEQYGYLTANPINMGTGLRASVLLFLPGLVAGEGMASVIRAVQAIGGGISGFFGNGSSPEGCMFQIYNRQTLGESEETIIRRIKALAETIEERELAAREELVTKNREVWLDRASRVMALLTHARSVSMAEALTLLSQARLASLLGMIAPDFVLQVDCLMASLLPVHLQLSYGAWMSEKRQDILRATGLRKMFEGVCI
jgi:protein arginine kinase